MAGEILRNSANVHDQDTGRLVGYMNPVTGKEDVTPTDVAVVSIGRSGAVWGNGSYVMGTATIPARTVKAGSMLRLRGLLSKLSPFNGGSSISVSLKQGSNTVTIGQTSLNATMANYPFAQDLQLSNDRKWAFTSGTNSVNFYGQAATAAGVYSLQTVVADGGPSTAYPRTQSTIAFTSYTSAPVVETVLIDFNRDVTLSVTVGIVTGDCVELLYCSLEAVSSLSNGLTTGLSPTIFLGDSLTEGTGANSGTCLINLKNWSDRTHSAQQIITELEEKAKGITGANIEFFLPPALPGYGAAGAQAWAKMPLPVQ